MTHRVEVQHPFSLGLWIAFGFFVFPIIIIGIIVMFLFVFPLALVTMLGAITLICELPAWALWLIGTGLALILGCIVHKIRRAQEIEQARRIVALLEASERR